MSSRNRSRFRLALPARAVLGAFRILLLGPVTLAGCAGPVALGQPDRAHEQAWTPPPPSPSALYADLRVERGSVPGAELQGAAEGALEFTEMMTRMLGLTVRNADPSPDGARMVFIVSEGPDSPQGQIWISRVNGSLPYLLHAGLGSARGTIWKDDGSTEGRIYFSSRGRVWSFRPVLLDVEETKS